MPINYLPNDPLAAAAPMRVVNPRPDRPAARAGFTFTDVQPEAAHPVDTPGFLFWQCREAALATLETWEDLTGAAFDSWEEGKKIALIQDAGKKLNAFFDRASLSFFHFPIGNKTYFSGASADVVAHEAGHGLLDAIRPDFWDSNLFEVNAIHEGFGDCVAVLTALFDRDQRVAVLPKLKQKNFVEATAEYLAEAIGKVDPNHNAAAARRARNTFQWQLPSTLPAIFGPGDGPGVLVNEIHSFGQVFSGCFYDTLVNIFDKTAGTEADLLASARTAGRLLIEGITQAPQKARFFREVGRSMVLADDQNNAGANRDAIKDAFEAHGITLGTGAMLSPTAALAGAAPKIGDKVSLVASVRKDLLARIGAAGAKMAVTALQLGKDVVAQAIHERLVPLDDLHKKLKGVVAAAPETVLLGDSGGRAAILGALPEPTATGDEVFVFVRSLLAQGAILFEEVSTAKKARAALAELAAAKPDEPLPPVTHAIRTIRGQPTLVRLCFECR